MPAYLPEEPMMKAASAATKDAGSIASAGAFAKYSLTVSLCYELKEADEANDKKFNNKVNNFLRFAMDNFETELVVMGIKLALTQYELPIDPDEVECFDEFHDRYGKYIKAAQGA